jgi:hypothetical protein
MQTAIMVHASNAALRISARPSDLLKLFLAALVKGDDFQYGDLPSFPQWEQQLLAAPTA